jgi:hypothetical protein
MPRSHVLPGAILLEIAKLEMPDSLLHRLFRAFASEFGTIGQFDLQFVCSVHCMFLF